jgi:hypothetical protein
MAQAVHGLRTHAIPFRVAPPFPTRRNVTLFACILLRFLLLLLHPKKPIASREGFRRNHNDPLLLLIR